MEKTVIHLTIVFFLIYFLQGYDISRVHQGDRKGRLISQQRPVFGCLTIGVIWTRLEQFKAIWLKPGYFYQRKSVTLWQCDA